MHGMVIPFMRSIRARLVAGDAGAAQLPPTSLLLDDSVDSA